MLKSALYAVLMVGITALLTWFGSPPWLVLTAASTMGVIAVIIKSRTEVASNPVAMIGEEQAAVFEECPDCGAELRLFLAGPAGGMSQNVMCGECRHEYNIATLGGHLILIDDLGTADAARQRFYGFIEDEIR